MKAQTHVAEGETTIDMTRVTIIASGMHAMNSLTFSELELTICILMERARLANMCAGCVENTFINLPGLFADAMIKKMGNLQ